MTKKHTRRAILAGGFASFVTGCAEKPVIIDAFNSLKSSIVGFPSAPIDRAIINSIPYATISAKIGISGRNILVLAKKERDNLHWTSSDRVVIVTRHGRVVKTAGLPENIKDTHLYTPDPLNRALHVLDGPRALSRTIDIDLNHRYAIPITSVFEEIGLREITISDLKIKTRLYIERNTAHTLNWSFNNFFWIDEFDGYVWKSRQRIAQTFDSIEIETLKPPSS